MEDVIALYMNHLLDAFVFLFAHISGRYLTGHFAPESVHMLIVLEMFLVCEFCIDLDLLHAGYQGVFLLRLLSPHPFLLFLASQVMPHPKHLPNCSQSVIGIKQSSHGSQKILLLLQVTFLSDVGKFKGLLNVGILEGGVAAEVFHELLEERIGFIGVCYSMVRLIRSRVKLIGLLSVGALSLGVLGRPLHV